jgi:hypothetical protein
MTPRTRRLAAGLPRIVARLPAPQFERWLAQLSFVVIPLALGGIMLLALLAWESDTVVKAPPDLPFTALSFVPDDGQIEPAAARDALRGLKPVTSFDTQLSEAPVWFAFTPPKLERQRSRPTPGVFPLAPCAQPVMLARRGAEAPGQRDARRHPTAH